MNSIKISAQTMELKPLDVIVDCNIGWF